MCSVRVSELRLMIKEITRMANVLFFDWYVLRFAKMGHVMGRASCSSEGLMRSTFLNEQEYQECTSAHLSRCLASHPVFSLLFPCRIQPTQCEMEEWQQIIEQPMEEFIATTEKLSRMYSYPTRKRIASFCRETLKVGAHIQSR